MKGIGHDAGEAVRVGELGEDSKSLKGGGATVTTGSVTRGDQGPWGDDSSSLVDGSNDAGEQQQPRRHGLQRANGRGSTGSSVSWVDANTSVSSKSISTTSIRSPSVLSSGRSLGDDMSRLQRESFAPKSASMKQFDMCKLKLDGELVGREAEKTLLREACAQAAAATSMTAGAGTTSVDTLIGSDDDDTMAINSGRCVPLALVHGYSGAGKTALVEAAVPKDKSQRIFLEGKFDLQNRIMPWTAFVAALSALPGQLDFLGHDKAEQIKNTVCEAMGKDHGLIGDLVPALQCLFSACPTPPAVHVEGGAEAKIKLQYLLTKFISALGTEGCPVIIFIDDLQWIDESSLDLLEALATDNESSLHTVLIGTYRSNEVDDDHILMKKLQIIKDRRGDTENNIIDIPLGNLSVPDLNTFLSTALNKNEDETTSLAKVIEKKTGGNPFFTIHFLLALEQEGILEFQFGALKWVWDEKAIETKFVADNVADLMRRKLLALPRDLQMILQVCACLGCDFDLRTLELATSAFPSGSLELNLEEYMEGAIAAGVISHAGQTYSFVHDQLQAASFNLIEKEDSNEFRGKIGRAVVENARVDEMETLLLIAIDLCNCDAGALSLTTKDKIKFATLNLRAGKKAMGNSAFSSCTSYLQCGIALIEYGVEFDDTRELQIDLYGMCAQAHYCNGDYDNMNQCLDTILSQNLTGKEKQPLLLTRIYSLIASSQLADCWDLCQRSLEDVVGYRPFPEKVSQMQIIASLIKTKYRMKKYRDKIVDLPLLEDETRIFAYKIIEIMVAASYYSGMPVMPLVVFRETRWTLKHGLCEYSPIALIMYSSVLIATNDLKGGAEIGRIAEQLLEKLKPEGTFCRCRYILEGLVYHWTNPLANRIKPLMNGYAVGMRSGHIEEAMFSLFHVIAFSWFSAKKLGDIKTFSIPVCTQMKDLGQNGALLLALPFVQTVLNLFRESSEDPTVLTGEVMNADEFLNTVTETNHLMGLTAMQTIQLELQYMFHNLEAAVDLLDMFAPGEKVYPGFFQTVRAAMFEAMTCFGMASSMASKSDQKKWRKKGEGHLKRIKAWVAAGNVNCVHSLSLVEAEQATSNGNAALAKSRYEHAISTAKRNGFIQDAALAHERAGLFFLAQDDSSWGKYHMEKSIELYNDWGCRAKVTHLTEKYSNLLSS